MDFLIKFLSRILTWLLAFVGWCVVEVMKLLMAGLTTVLNAIPVPDWMASAGTALSALPSTVCYFAGCMNLGTGIGVIVSAYVLRFAIRRIPLIG